MIPLERLERAFERVFSRHSQRRSWRHEDATYRAMIHADRKALARLLHDELRGGRYVQRPVATSFVQIGNKRRSLVRLHPIDQVVHAVLAEDLTASLSLPNELWSFRKGRSDTLAVRSFARHVRKQHKKPVRERGLFVLRADVIDYGDSIPLAKDAPLWAMLGKDHEATQRALRVVIQDQDAEYSPLYGLPTGSPLVPPIENLYLLELDQTFTAHGGHYARYGDDMLFAHEDLATVRAAEATMTRVLKTLHLRARSTLSFFNGAGRANAVPGCSAVTFLGCSIGFDGTVALPADKQRRTLVELRRRLRETHALIADQPPSVRAQTLVRVVNRSLDPRAVVALDDAQRLAGVVTSRRQLEAMDYAFALMLAETLSGSKGVRAFRRFSPRQLRSHGLVSLVASRNRGRSK